jgi:hypothetical protein
VFRGPKLIVDPTDALFGWRGWLPTLYLIGARLPRILVVPCLSQIVDKVLQLRVPPEHGTLREWSTMSRSSTSLLYASLMYSK